MSRFVIFLTLIIVVIAIATFLVYRYFDKKHERELKRRKEDRRRTDELVGIAEDEYGKDK